MKRIFALIILAASLVGGALAGARWTLFMNMADGSKTYLDVNSLQWSPDRSNFKGWIKGVEPDNSYTLMHIELDRETKRNRFTALAHYNAKGILDQSSDEVSAWEDILPDSLADNLYDAAFSTKPSTPARGSRGDS